jgi:hypothetical protein
MVEFVSCIFSTFQPEMQISLRKFDFALLLSALLDLIESGQLSSQGVGLYMTLEITMIINSRMCSSHNKFASTLMKIARKKISMSRII